MKYYHRLIIRHKVLKRFYDSYSLTYEILKGYAYGKIVKGTENTWNGMAGALQSKSADLTVSELSITSERNEVLSYTQPVYIIR